MIRTKHLWLITPILFGLIGCGVGQSFKPTSPASTAGSRAPMATARGNSFKYATDTVPAYAEYMPALPGPYSFRPLLAWRSKDRQILQVLKRDIASARVAKLVREPYAQPREESGVTLGYWGDRMLFISPYYRAVKHTPHAMESEEVPGYYIMRWETGACEGTASPEVVYSKALFQLFNDRNLFASENQLAVSTQGQTLNIIGHGVVAKSVAIILIPSFTGTAGGMDQGGKYPGSFVLATVPVEGDSFKWIGIPKIPPGWNAYHPVSTWKVQTYVVRPIKGLATPYGFGAEHPIWLPISTPISAIKSPGDAWAALNDGPGGYADDFPYWPTGIGSYGVRWRSRTGANDYVTYEGTEVCTNVPAPGGYRDELDLIFRDVGVKGWRQFNQFWLVSKNGTISEGDTYRQGPTPAGAYDQASVKVGPITTALAPALRAARVGEIQTKTYYAVRFNPLVYLFISSNGPIQNQEATMGQWLGVPTEELNQLSSDVREAYRKIEVVDPTRVGTLSGHIHRAAGDQIVAQLNIQLRILFGSKYPAFEYWVNEMYPVLSGHGWVKANL